MVIFSSVSSGFVLIGLNLSQSAALHLMAIGGFGLMILAMISRVSLGHSGRPLELVKGFWVAYVAIIVAAIARVTAQFFSVYYFEFIWLALIGWLLGYGLFAWHYMPILVAARTDGRPG